MVSPSPRCYERYKYKVLAQCLIQMRAQLKYICIYASVSMYICTLYDICICKHVQVCVYVSMKLNMYM